MSPSVQRLKWAAEVETPFVKQLENTRFPADDAWGNIRFFFSGPFLGYAATKANLKSEILDMKTTYLVLLFYVSMNLKKVHTFKMIIR